MHIAQLLSALPAHPGAPPHVRPPCQVKLVGRERLVLDLSCRRKQDGRYYVVTDRWQKFSELALRWGPAGRCRGDPATLLLCGSPTAETCCWSVSACLLPACLHRPSSTPEPFIPPPPPPSPSHHHHTHHPTHTTHPPIHTAQ
jgi:hypothetical protein